MQNSLVSSAFDTAKIIFKEIHKENIRRYKGIKLGRVYE